MKNPSYDPGLGQKLQGNLQRLIDDNGRFAIVRSNVPLSAFNPYIFLISSSWFTFFGIIVASFATINAVFAGIYNAVGLEHLHGSDSSSQINSFLSAYYFSVHTFTTVGYGNMSPEGTAMNVVSIIEILCGVLCVALITGLLYGRFSRPTAKLLYSDNIIIAPHNNATALMFRVSNLRNNVLMELEAELMVMLTHTVNGTTERVYKQLALERKRIVFLPLTWTLVHPIDEDSPLYGKDMQYFQQSEAQFLIMIKGFDDMFSQVVHSRFSYTFHELLWGAKFELAYQTREDGKVSLDVALINAHSNVELAQTPQKRLADEV